MIAASAPYKGILLVLSYVAAVSAGMFLMSQWDTVDALEIYKQQVEQTAAIQAKLDSTDLKLAEMQRAKHEQRTIEIVKTEVKWRDAPAAAKQSCIDSGLFDITDAVLGTNRPTDNSD